MQTIIESGLISGDAILSANQGWLSKSIRWFENMQTKQADKSHVAVAIDNKNCIEAVAKIKRNPLSKYDEPGQVVEVYRLPLSGSDRQDLRDGLIDQVNKGYGWFKIPLFALDSVSTGIAQVFGRKKPVFFFTKYFGITSFKVCSHLFVWALHKYTAYRLKDHLGAVVNWRAVSPDRLEDLFKLKINTAVLVYSNATENKKCDIY